MEDTPHTKQTLLVRAASVGIQPSHITKTCKYWNELSSSDVLWQPLALASELSEALSSWQPTEAIPTWKQKYIDILKTRCAMCDGVTANEVDKEYGIKICDKCRKTESAPHYVLGMYSIQEHYGLTKADLKGLPYFQTTRKATQTTSHYYKGVIPSKKHIWKRYKQFHIQVRVAQIYGSCKILENNAKLRALRIEREKKRQPYIDLKKRLKAIGVSIKDKEDSDEVQKFIEGKSEKTIDELVAEIQQTTKAERQQELATALNDAGMSEHINDDVCVKFVEKGNPQLLSVLKVLEHKYNRSQRKRQKIEKLQY